MYYIFASSTKKDLTPINEIKTEDIGYAIPSGYKVTSEYHYKYRQKTRIFDCYIIDESKSGKIEPNQTKEQVSFFHGYLLEPFNSAEDLAPDQNYYGVYSHGKIKNDDCYFATDEIRRILSEISGITGNIVSEQQTNFLDNLLPTLKNDLIDMLPEETFEFINKEAIIQSLSKEQFSFDKSSFPLINLYGVAQWYQVVGGLNERN